MKALQALWQVSYKESCAAACMVSFATRLPLWTIGHQLLDRGESEEKDVTIIGLAATEQFVRSVEPVQDTQRAVVLVEPVGRRQRVA